MHGHAVTARSIPLLYTKSCITNGDLVEIVVD